MKRYLYLSLYPEALVASMLDPAQFGRYLAVGSSRRSQGQAFFFEVDPGFESDYFDLSIIEKHCVPHADGSPHRSAYISIYRALEHVPLDALRDLHLATRHGEVLALKKAPYEPEPSEGFYLYQEISPVTPRVVSRLEPRAFGKFITDPGPIHLPRLVFADMKLGQKARRRQDSDDIPLPYPNIDHLEECLFALEANPKKQAKTVNRDMQQDVLYFMIRKGFYLADASSFLYYPLPDEDDLAANHHNWWRSAKASPGY